MTDDLHAAVSDATAYVGAIFVHGFAGSDSDDFTVRRAQSLKDALLRHGESMAVDAMALVAAVAVQAIADERGEPGPQLWDDFARQMGPTLDEMVHRGPPGRNLDTPEGRASTERPALGVSVYSDGVVPSSSAVRRPRTAATNRARWSRRR